jgi:Xaa-Pro aminopeptidase
VGRASLSFVATILLYGDTIRHPAVRHEVPVEIMDPLLFVARDGQAALVLTSSLERARIARALPSAELVMSDELGLVELLGAGMDWDEAQTEVVVRALRRWGISEAVVAPDLGVAIADRLRAEGIALTIDGPAVSARRRAKTPAELDGITRAQRAAEAGMAAAERLIRGAGRRGGRLWDSDERELTAEAVRAAIRAACAGAGAPAPPDIMVVSTLSGGGHDPGSGPLPADLPITIDLGRGTRRAAAGRT